MNYDFETIVNRENRGSLKAVMTPEILKKNHIVTFAAGEMDFRTAPSLCEAVRRTAENGLFGFTLKDSKYLSHVCWWMKEVRDWEISTDWVVTAYGTIFSIAIAIRAFLKEDEKIIVQPPFYSRYKQAADRIGRKTVYNPMIQRGDYYVMDLEGLEKLMEDEKNRLLILCNPHNPSGRVFTKAELTEVAKLSAKYKTIVFSDEIFAEVMLNGEKTTPYASIEEGQEWAITCTSLGKTFNCTGLNHVNVIIPNESLRKCFEKQRTSDHYGSIDPCAYAATVGAYSPEGLDWVLAMREVIKKNSDYVHSFMETYLPQFPVMKTEGSFVCFIDFSSLGKQGTELEEYLIEKALFHIDPGSEYGSGYESFARMNLGSTFEQTKEAMERLYLAFGKNSGKNNIHV